MNYNEEPYRPEEDDWYRKEYEDHLLEATHHWEKAVEEVAERLMLRGWSPREAYQCAVYEVGEM